MPEIIKTVESEKAQEMLGMQLAEQCRQGLVIFLHGELGLVKQHWHVVFCGGWAIQAKSKVQPTRWLRNTTCKIKPAITLTCTDWQTRKNWNTWESGIFCWKRIFC